VGLLDRFRGAMRRALGVEQRVIVLPRPPARRNFVEPPGPLPSSPPASRVTKVGDGGRNIETHNSHPGHGITIEKIVAVFRSAEVGQPAQQFDLFDNTIENDGHYRGLIEGRIQGVAGRDWVLRPGGTDAGSLRAAADLEAHLRNVNAFRDFIEHQLMAPHFGFSASSIKWDLVEGKAMPTWFLNHAHRRFVAPRNELDRVNEIEFVESTAPWSQIPLEPGRWAVTRARGRNVWASGTCRTGTWFAAFKRWSGRDWQMFAEMFGLPIRIGFYEESASPESRQALRDAVEAIGEDGYAVLSAATELVVKEAVRSGDANSVWPAIIAWCNAEMSKLKSGGTLNVDSGQAGSYALGAVHEARSFAFALSDAARIEEMFVRDLGTPFVAWNGYGGAKPPRLKIQILRDLDPEKRARVIAILVNEVGLDVDEDQIREEFGLRPPTGAPLKGREKPAPAGSGFGGGAKLALGLGLDAATLEGLKAALSSRFGRGAGAPALDLPPSPPE